MKFAAMVAAALTAFSGTTTTPALPAACVAIERPLSLNSVGADVARLQMFLGVRTTGYFGPITRNALIEWQLRARVISSSRSPGAGTTGPVTRAALKCPTLPAATTLQRGAIVPPSVPIQAPASTSPTSTANTQGSAAISLPGSSGVSPSTRCAPFTTPEPPASQCEWQWQLINDEADCPALWECSDPNPVQ